MKFRTTIILLILVIGLGAFLLIYTARQPSTSEVKESQSRLFAGSEFQEPGAARKGGLSDLATRLELRHGADVVALERSTENLKREWRIVKPASLPADSGAVTAILGEIEFLKITRKLIPEKDAPLDLKSYGLEPPERSITFGIGEKSWTLNVGSKTPDGQSVYVARADAKSALPCVVPVSVLEKASERVNDLRDKAALRFDKSAVTRVELVPAGGTALTISRDMAGWRLSGAVQDQADTASVTRLLDAIALVRVDASDFIADGDSARSAEFGLDKPRFKLAVYEGKTGRTLCLGADVKDRSGKCYAMREGDNSLFALDKKSADGLMKSPADLRSKVALDFNPDEVTAITVTPAAEPGRAAQTVRLVHPKDQWMMEEPAGVTMDPEQAVLFLTDLHNLEVTDWVDNPTPERLAACGLAAPAMTVTLQTKPDAAPVALQFGKPAEKPDTCYARRGNEAPQQSAPLHATGQGPILIIPAELLTRLQAGYLLFVSRTMLEFNKEDATAVRIVRPGGVVALEKLADRWTVVEPAEGEANIPHVENLLYGLAFLDAERIEAEKSESLGAYGLDAPRIKVTVTLKSAEAPKSGPSAMPVLKTVLIGKELPEGDSYAMLEGGRRIFVLKGTTVNLFLTDFVKAKKADAPKDAAH